MSTKRQLDPQAVTYELRERMAKYGCTLGPKMTPVDEALAVVILREDMHISQRHWKRLVVIDASAALAQPAGDHQKK